MSEVKKIVFDGDVQIDVIRDLMVVSRSDYNVTLSWNYDKPFDGFIVEIEAREPYPRLPDRIAYRTNITVFDLAPSVIYTFKVRWESIVLDCCSEMFRFCYNRLDLSKDNSKVRILQYQQGQQDFRYRI